MESKQKNQDEISLKDLIIKIKQWICYLKLKIKPILIFAILGSLIGITLSFIIRPIYKAQLTFAMEDDKGANGGLSGAIGLASSIGIDIGGTGGGGAFTASNLAVLMKSHLIIEKVLLNTYSINGKKRTLADYYIEINNLRGKWKNKANLKNIQFLPGTDRSKFSRIQDSLLFEFHKELTNKENLDIFQKDKKVTILAIEVNSKDEIFSKIFCEAVANETSELYIQTKSKKARMNTNVLQKQVDSVKFVLNKNITGVAKEADNVFNLNPTLNIRSSNSKKIQVDVTANTEVLKQLIVQLELSKITLRKETPLIQLIDKPILPLEKEKLSKKKSLIFGFLIGGLSSIFYFVLIRVYRNLIND
jgi:hypothetical protein